MESDDSTLPHFDDVVGKSGGIFAVMRHVDHCQLEGMLQPREFRSQLHAKLGVETRQGLVQQQNPRLTDDCACESDTLLFSAGELVRVARRVLLDSNERECPSCSPGSLGSRYMSGAENEFEILTNRQMWPQGEVLEHEAEPSLMRRYESATCG